MDRAVRAATLAELEALVREVRDHHPDADVDAIRRAYGYAEEHHRGQFRHSGEPYITHPVGVARICAGLGLDPETIQAALLHDVGKPATRVWSEEKKDWTFHGHDVVSARMAKKILNDLKFPKETVGKVTTFVRMHMFFSDPDVVTLSAVRRVIARVGKENINDLLNLRVCDRIGTGRPKAHPFRLRKYMSMVDEAMRDPISVGMLKIDGTRLIEMGEAAGPRIGWILHALLEEVLDDPKKNTEEYLESRAQELAKLPEKELRELGEEGKDRKAEEDDAAVRKLREKHHVQ